MNAYSLHLTSPQRKHHTIGSEYATVIIGLGLRGHAGRKGGVSADVEQPTHGCGDNVRRLIVGIGSTLSKSREGDQDDFWLILRKDAVAEAKAVHVPWLITFQNNIRPAYKL